MTAPTETTTKPTKTQAAVYDMLCENTGIHMMDSGGTDGRMWQRNSKRTIEDFMAAPSAYLRYEMLVVSLFHTLSENLIYLPDSTEELRALGHKNPDASWDELIEQWVESRGGIKGESYYTYNYANSLDQDFICNEAELVVTEHSSERGYAEAEETVCIIRSHNGADARGGFSTPVVFTLIDVHTSTFDIADVDIDASCQQCASGFRYTTVDHWTCWADDGNAEEHENCSTTLDAQLDYPNNNVSELHCPHCTTGVLALEASFTY